MTMGVTEGALVSRVFAARRSLARALPPSLRTVDRLNRTIAR